MGQGEEQEKVQGKGRINTRSGTKNEVSFTADIKDYVPVPHLDELCQGADRTAKGKARKPLPLTVVP